MVFSKIKFLEEADGFTKRLYSPFLNDIDGKEVDFGDKAYGTIHINNEEHIYPVYKEWCTDVSQMKLDI